MATAIDFMAMMAAERKKMRAEMIAKRGATQAPAADSATPGVMATSAAAVAAPAPMATGYPADLCMGWLDFPDRAVPLTRRSAVDLSEFHVSPGVLSGVYYIPDFVTEGEGDALLDRIAEMPETAWARLKRRRLQNHGGTPHPDGMLPTPVPSFIDSVMAATVQTGIFEADAPPNHVLLNEYRRGQGIAPHQDGPLYHPVVAILSLAGPAMLQFWPSLRATKDGCPGASVMCLPNSLLVFSEDAYLTHWHGIEQVDADTISEHTGNLASIAINAGGGGGNDSKPLAVGSVVPRGDKRVSLTVRRVLKVRDPDSEIHTPAGREEDRRKQEWWLKSRGEEGALS